MIPSEIIVCPNQGPNGVTFIIMVTSIDSMVPQCI